MTWDPDWWDWYNDYLRSPEWSAFREQAFDYHGERCVDCRRWRDQLDLGEWLEIDHVTYERVGHELLEDVRVRCNTCHRKKTKARRRWRTVKRVLGV
jgi:hypothetical protein